MNELIEKISQCVERGKVNKSSPYPNDMRGMDGADESTRQALEAAIKPDAILQMCNDGMQCIGARFSRNEVFIPELLMAAKAMHAVIVHLEPFFKTKRRENLFLALLPAIYMTLERILLGWLLKGMVGKLLT